ncbi:MAG: glycosyltransferase family 2 protein [Planctomycetota bacterium]
MSDPVPSQRTDHATAPVLAPTPTPAAGTVTGTPPKGTPPAAARVVAVLVHYRCADDTLGCIASIQEHAPGTPVLVVDNAAADGSGAALAQRCAGFAQVTVLHARTNRGFGAGCNGGIDRAVARFPELEHVLLLNPDARLRPGALQQLRNCARNHPRAGVVGCRIVEPDGDVWFANGRFPRFSLSRFHTRPPGGATEFETGFVTGCCMLIDAGMLRRGLRFDPSFFLYGEDADLCRRVQQRGRSLWVTQAATVEHRGGGSQPGPRVLDELSAERLYWLTRAKVLLARKHYEPWRRAVFLLVAALVKPLAAVLTGRGVRWLPAYARGLWAGLSGGPGTGQGPDRDAG